VYKRQHPKGTLVEKWEFRGSRQGIRWSASEAALALLHRYLGG